MKKTQSKIIKNHFEKVSAESNGEQSKAKDDDLKKLIRLIVLEEIKILREELSAQQEPEFLTIRDAASFLNLAVNTLYEKTSQKQIPFHKRDKKLYFKKEELKEWLMGGKHEGEIMKLPILKQNKKAA